MARSLVVINPRASRVRDAATLAELSRRLTDALTRRDGLAPQLVQTATAAEVGPLVAEALGKGVAAVIGVGGDGTMRDIASVLAGTGIPLGIVPAGTGNQVAAVLGIPRSPLEAAAVLERARRTTIDLGEVTVRARPGASLTTSFIIGCGAGFDAELMATTSARLKQRLGSAAYFVQGARLAIRHKATPCRLTVDDRTVTMEVSLALIGNMGHLVPGRLGLRLPLDPSDGLLELIAVDAGNPVRAVRGLLDQLRRTGLGGSPEQGSLRLRGEQVAIEPLEPTPLEVDGDHVGTGRLEARVRAGVLGVLTPVS